MKKKFLSSLFAIGMIATALVWSCNKKNAPIAVTDVELSDDNINIMGWGTATLTATILPENATDKAVRWTSENENIATIDANGKVTAKSAGKTIIKVTTQDGGKTATCQVKVTPTANIAPGATHYITMVTEMPTTEKLELVIYAANEADEAGGVWIDLNNNGKKDTGEEITNFDFISKQAYEFTSPTITLYGKVTYLECSHNRLSQLDVSHNTDLEGLISSKNYINTIDLTKNIRLQNLSLFGAVLTELDLSHNTNLEWLELGFNRLKDLNLKAQKELRYLGISYNELTTLDVSQNTKLREIYGHLNQIEGKGVDDLIASLPTREVAIKGNLYLNVKTETSSDIITATRIAAAKAKNWRVFTLPEGANDWVEQ